jgi:hypothetical protein
MELKFQNPNFLNGKVQLDLEGHHALFAVQGKVRMIEI